MNEDEWLSRATSFDLGMCPYHPNRPIVIEKRDQIDGSRKWVLKMREWVLGKDGEFHYEPIPSSRTEDFIENTRFDSPSQVWHFWKENIKGEKVLSLN